MSDSKKPGPGQPGRRSNEVGYGRPPKHTQFQPGRSGNPGGRRKARLTSKTGQLGDLLAVLLAEPIEITINGKKTRVTTEEAILFRTISDAMRGDSKARRDLLRLRELHPPTVTRSEEEAAAADKELRRRLDAIYDRIGQAAAQRAREGGD